MYFENIGNLRIDTDKTQEDVAKILNCNRDVYRRYEKGLNEIPVWALIKLAELYDVSTDYLLGLTEVKKRQHKNGPQ